MSDGLEFSGGDVVDSDPTLARRLAELKEDIALSRVEDVAKREEGTRKTATQSPAGQGSDAKRSVFVGNVDRTATENDLRLLFASCGKIVRATIVKDHATGTSRGYAFIEFETEEGAQQALLKDSQAFRGQPLKVIPKRDDSNVPRGRGRGMYRGGAQMGAMGMMPMMNPLQMMQMLGGAGSFMPYGMPRGGRGRGRGFQ